MADLAAPADVLRELPAGTDLPAVTERPVTAHPMRDHRVMSKATVPAALARNLPLAQGAPLPADLKAPSPKN